MQRIRLALSIKKGMFPYDREMGIDFTKSNFFAEECDSEDRRLKKLEMLINEAVCPIFDCRVTLKSYDENENTAVIIVFFEDSSHEMEVKLFG